MPPTSAWQIACGSCMLSMSGIVGGVVDESVHLRARRCSARRCLKVEVWLVSETCDVVGALSGDSRKAVIASPSVAPRGPETRSLSAETLVVLACFLSIPGLACVATARGALAARTLTRELVIRDRRVGRTTWLDVSSSSSSCLSSDFHGFTDANVRLVVFTGTGGLWLN